MARRLNLSIAVVITDGRQPIGRGIGPMLEARDVMRVLRNHPLAPDDLRQKSLRLAGRLLECDPDIRGGDGYGIARNILDSGRALDKMMDIIRAQGEHTFDPENPPLAPLTHEVQAMRDGVVTGIDNLQIARIARLAGAPKVPSAGVDLLHKLGEPVRTGEPLYRIHAAYASDLDFARQASERHSGYTVGGPDEVPSVYVEF